MSLNTFVQKCPAVALDALTTYLTERSQEYMETSRSIAHNSNNRAHLRVQHHLSMAQALFSLAEHITQEREGQHGNR
jgi:ABC-type cobalamin/Fe3+-siderophores transport system ATPase subunit